jgi:predicted transposase YdaD
MDAEAKALYDAHIKDRRISYDVLETARMEGREDGIEEGIEKGIEKGREEERLYLVVNAYKQGIAIPVIALIAAISEEEVARILGEQGFV